MNKPYSRIGWLEAHVHLRRLICVSIHAHISGLTRTYIDAHIFRPPFVICACIYVLLIAASTYSARYMCIYRRTYNPAANRYMCVYFNRAYRLRGSICAAIQPTAQAKRPLPVARRASALQPSSFRSGTTDMRPRRRRRAFRLSSESPLGRDPVPAVPGSRRAGGFSGRDSARGRFSLPLRARIRPHANGRTSANTIPTHIERSAVFFRRRSRYIGMHTLDTLMAETRA